MNAVGLYYEPHQKILNESSIKANNFIVLMKNRRISEKTNIIKTSKKLIKQRFLIIDKPLQLSSKKSARNVDKVTSTFINQEVDINESCELLNESLESDVSPYNEKRVIKSIVRNSNEESKSQSNNTLDISIKAEDIENAGVSKINFFKRKDYQDVNAEHAFINYKSQEIKFEPHENKCVTHNIKDISNKNNDYVINKYSLPNKLSGCIKQFHPRKIVKAKLNPKPLQLKGIYGWKLK